MKSTENQKSYWARNIQLLTVLLLIWFTVSFGFGILFVNALDSIRVGGFKLGFWFAQQGTIYIFVLLIFAYTWFMKKLDKKHNMDED